VKDYLTSLTLWLAGVGSLLLLLYFLASPLIFLNTAKGPAASPLLRELSGPVIHVLESDFKGPMLWYFGLWGIEIDYFAREPVPRPPWYVGPAYVLVSAMCLAGLGSPLWKSWLRNARVFRRTSARSELRDESPITY